MKAAIFTGPKTYNIARFFTKCEDAFIIGADQGALFLAEHQFHFDLAIGDFDSVKKRDLPLIHQYADEIQTFSSIKNFTDTYLAVEEALKRGYDEIVIYGGIGNRFDHSYANVFLLQLGNITMVSDNEVMYMLDPGFYDINNEAKYFSLFAIEDVSSLTIKGFKYELNSSTLLVGDPLCVSNQGQGTIEFADGVLLVIHQNE